MRLIESFSGLTANPAVGEAADLIVAAGGTVVLSEITEMVGAERVLARRAKTEGIRDELLSLFRRYEIDLSMSTEDDSEIFITPGNIEGGLTTIEEKSLGCIHKAGTHPIAQIVGYGEVPREKGVIIMDTPGYDISSVTGKVAGGAHMVLFTTGKGTPTGSPVAPVIKISSNNRTFRHLNEDIDMTAGDVMEGTKTLKRGRTGDRPAGHRHGRWPAGEVRIFQRSGIRHPQRQRDSQGSHPRQARRTERLQVPRSMKLAYMYATPDVSPATVRRSRAELAPRWRASGRRATRAWSCSCATLAALRQQSWNPRFVRRARSPAICTGEVYGEDGLSFAIRIP